MLGCRTDASGQNSESFTQQTPATTPALYTYNAYSTANCAASGLIVTFNNIPTDGTCVLSTPPSNFLSIKVVVAPPPATTTIVTINVGAIVGAVVSVLFTTISSVLFCRYQKVCCFAQPGFTPSAPTVMNPVGIVVK